MIQKIKIKHDNVILTYEIKCIFVTLRLENIFVWGQAPPLKFSEYVTTL
jgi:hypothetical protein